MDTITSFKDIQHADLSLLMTIKSERTELDASQCKEDSTMINASLSVTKPVAVMDGLHTEEPLLKRMKKEHSGSNDRTDEDTYTVHDEEENKAEKSTGSFPFAVDAPDNIKTEGDDMENEDEDEEEEDDSDDDDDDNDDDEKEEEEDDGREDADKDVSKNRSEYEKDAYNLSSKFLNKEKMDEDADSSESFGSVSWPHIEMRRLHVVEKQFNCSGCDQSFSSKTCLKAHMKSHGGNDGNKCESFTEHLEVSNPTGVCKRKKKSHPCPYCSKILKRKTDLRNHVVVHTGEKRFICPVCSERFGHRSSFLRHVRAHSGDHKFKCSVCGKAYAEKSELLGHMSTHTGVKFFPCTQCDKTFSLPTNLRRHMKRHKGVKQHECPECGKGFYDRYKLTQHMTVHDPGKPVMSADGTFACSKCELSFSRQCNLQRHMTVHGEDYSDKPPGKRSVLCKECDKWFSSSSYLKIHLRTHTGEKPYSCSKCDKTFNQKSTLRTHMSRHSDAEDRRICPECGKSCAPVNFKEHLKVHTGARPYMCRECGQTFKQSSHLKSHTRAHAGDKPYVCLLCSKSFVRRTNLRDHMRTQHPLNTVPEAKSMDEVMEMFCVSPGTKTVHKGTDMYVTPGTKNTEKREEGIDFENGREPTEEKMATFDLSLGTKTNRAENACGIETNTGTVKEERRSDDSGEDIRI